VDRHDGGDSGFKATEFTRRFNGAGRHCVIRFDTRRPSAEPQIHRDAFSEWLWHGCTSDNGVDFNA